MQYASMKRIYRLGLKQNLNMSESIIQIANVHGQSISKQKLMAALIGGHVESVGSISQSGSTSIQQSSRNLSPTWQCFNIASEEVVNLP